jgi:hypothetical protein
MRQEKKWTCQQDAILKTEYVQKIEARQGLERASLSFLSVNISRIVL